MEERAIKILFNEEEISKRVKELGKEISKEYKDKNPLLISLLRGSFIFAADLVRAMDILLEIDFLTTSSYGNEESSSGDVRLFSDLRSEVLNRDVIIVDDIVDTGHTMKKVVEEMEKLGAKSVKSCSLLNKESRREVDIKPDYVGFEIEDVFIVGYGLNYKDNYRNVPYIYTYL